MEPPPEHPPRIIPSLRKVLQVLLATAGNRLELAAVETQEEAARWVESLLLVAALAALGSLALAMLTLTIVVAYWEEHRVATLVGLSAFYLLAVLGAAFRLRWRLRNWPSFAATIAEFKKDQACLDHQRPKS